MITVLEGTRVLITGASGFIGSHLSSRLVQEGAEVHAIVRQGSMIPSLGNRNNGIYVHYADLTDINSIQHIIRVSKPQKLFHLAATVDVSRSMETISSMIQVNLNGTLNLIRALDKDNCDCIINSGTCEEYGDNNVPFTEDQLPNPVSPYSASKAATTIFCSMLYKTERIPIVTLRPFLTYGPGQDNDMFIPSIIKASLQDRSLPMTFGEQTREFNYIDDIVDGYIKASITPKALGAIINLGNGIEFKIKDVAEMVVKLTGSKVRPKFGDLEYRSGEAMHFYCDNNKARNILGWESSVTLEEGLSKTIVWMKKRLNTESY